MVFMFVVFLFPSTPQTTVADMNYTVVVIGGIMALSLGWYYFPKYGGVHWFTGPVSNLSRTPSQEEGLERSSHSDIADQKKGVLYIGPSEYATEI
jgi:hypothetical protein